MAPSWLCLKEHGPNKAIVVRIAPGSVLGSGKHRIYDGWLDGVKVYDAEQEFKVGQIVRVG